MGMTYRGLEHHVLPLSENGERKAELWLPVDLTVAEADRLTQIVESLAFGKATP